MSNNKRMRNATINRSKSGKKDDEQAALDAQIDAVVDDFHKDDLTDIEPIVGGDILAPVGVGGLLAVSINGDFYFPAFDNNGNVTKYIDESGTIVAAYEYNPFGKTISQSGSLRMRT